MLVVVLPTPPFWLATAMTLAMARSVPASVRPRCSPVSGFPPALRPPANLTAGPERGSTREPPTGAHRRLSDCYILPHRNANGAACTVDDTTSVACGGSGAGPDRLDADLEPFAVALASSSSSSVSGRGPFIAMMRPVASSSGRAPATSSATVKVARLITVE